MGKGSRVNMLVKTNERHVRRARAETLLSRTVAIANSQCGRLADERCQTRTAFYGFDGPDRLVRRTWAGRPGTGSPRADFVAGRSRADRAVIEAAQSDDWMLVRDVDRAPPEHFTDYQGRAYRSFLMVPVRSQSHSFGFLSVDSDRPNTLSEADVSYVLLMAGLLAAAFNLDGTT